MTRVLFDSLFLFVIGFAATLHLNRMHKRGWFECAGFALIAAGAFGCLLEYWWPFIVANLGFGRHQTDYWSYLVMHAGFAVAASQLCCADMLRMVRYEPTRGPLHRHVLELAAIVETREELQLLRQSARLALANEGIDWRAAKRDPRHGEPPTADPFLEDHAGRGS